MNRTDRCYLSFGSRARQSGERTRLACWRWLLAIANFFSFPFNRLTQMAGRSFRRGRRNQHARARALPRTLSTRHLYFSNE